MTALKTLTVGLAVVLGLGLLPSVSEANYGRQYYGGWSYNKSYHYRPYYYKPYPSYSGYKHNYVVYYQSDPKHYYYYSPYTKQYWGRCPINTQGVGTYSFLEPMARPMPSEITPEPPKNEIFPEPTAKQLPTIPQTPEEKVKDPNPEPLDLPPDDLPPKVGGVPAPGTGPGTGAKDPGAKDPAIKE